MPGLPGAAISSLAAWRLPQAPGERIFAAARTQQQDVHGSPRRQRRAGLLADVAPGDNSPPLTRQRAVGRLKRTIETAFGKVRVRGEISGFKRHASGHCYFTLKDDAASIDAVIWRGSAWGRWRSGPRTAPK